MTESGDDRIFRLNLAEPFTGDEPDSYLFETREEFRVAVLAAAEAEGISSNVAEDSGEPPNVRPIEPFVTTAIVIAGVFAAATLIISLIERWRGGLVIDLRKNATDDIYRDRAVPFQHVVIKASDGTVKIETKDVPKDVMERILTEILSKTLDSAKSIAEKAKELLPGVGDDKVKEAT